MPTLHTAVPGSKMNFLKKELSSMVVSKLCTAVSDSCHPNFNTQPCLAAHVSSLTSNPIFILIEIELDIELFMKVVDTEVIFPKSLE